jgi:hypothetical protein
MTKFRLSAATMTMLVVVGVGYSTGARAQMQTTWQPPIVMPPPPPPSPWLDMVSATQAAQPHWMTPLITVTPRLEQEIRVDFYDQRNASPTTSSQGNGYNLYNYGGPGGIRAELIPTYNTELIVAYPPYVRSYSPTGAVTTGSGDWPAFLVKYRIASESEENGNYIVTAFFQVTDELGTPGHISTNVTTAQPTLAFGKGWGDFDIQMTVSEQFPIGAASPESQNMRNFGDPIQVNTTFQYHLWQYFWPEFEVNYEYWPNGEHANLNQVLLTPGIIFGRFQIGNSSPTRPINLIMGAGYQFAVTGNPVIQNNIVGTVRVTF